MKLVYYSSLLLAFLLFTNNAQAQEDKKAKAKAVKEFSYSYGYRFGKTLKEKEEFEASEKDPKQIIKGIKAGLNPDSTTLAKLGAYVEDRVSSDEYEVTPENAKNMAYNLGYLSAGNVIYTFELPASDFHYGSIKKGFSDFTKGKTPMMKEEKMEEVISAYFEKVQEEFAKKEEEKKAALAKRNKEKSAAFLVENGKKEGVTTTASGLQYSVLTAGSGASPTLSDKVKVHYHGTTIDGKVFDSSVDRGEPISFPLQNLIQGWQEGIPLMKEGAKYRFFIPANLAYGDNAPPAIGPGQTLIFDVELLAIEKKLPSNPKVDRSYSYGYMIGQSLKKVELTDKETDTQQFITGLVKGFDSNPEELAKLESLIKNRLQGGEPSVSDEAAMAIAYSIGYTSSTSMSQQLGCKLADFDMNKIAEGYQLAKTGGEPRLNMDEMNQVLQAYFEPKQQAKQAEQAKSDESAAFTNIEAGKKFLEENSKKEGVITLPSGLQYMIIKEGTGEKPTLQSKVSTHYHGTTIDGKVFDSSIERGQPASFPVSGVIKGWTEALQLMPVGSKWRLFVPYNLAYGTRAMGPKIPAGSTLLFDVELLEIVK